MRAPEMESPALPGGAFAWVFSCAPEHLPLTPTDPTDQCLPELIERHLGREFLAALAVGGVE